MKKYFILLISLLCITATFAQSVKTIYYDSKWAEVSKNMYYQYYREYYKSDSGYVVKDYYRDETVQMEGVYADKKMKSRTGYFIYYSQYHGKSSEGRYENNVMVGTWKMYTNKGKLSYVKKYDSEGKLNGNYISYFENGVVNYKCKYKHGKMSNDSLVSYDSASNIVEIAYYNDKGKRQGKVKSYYPGGKILSSVINYNDDEWDDTCFFYYRNGKLASWEIYNEGKYDRKKCFEENGDVVECTEKIYVGPKIDEEKTIGEYLQKKVIYPKKAIEDKAEGSVRFGFRVDTLGNVYDLVIVEAVHPSFKKQIEKAVTGMGKLTPAILHNRKFDDYLEFNYTFNLKN